MNPRFLKNKIAWLVLVALCLFNVLVWGTVVRADRQGVLTVAFLDVGQGDALYIEAPNGNQLLIDGGGGRQVLRSLGNVMPFYDHSLDMVLLTHPDQDHVGGLPFVFERVSIANVATTENTSATGAYVAFENAIEEKKTRRMVVRAGERFILDKGVVLEILFPDRNTQGWETNTSSVVARLSYGEVSFLLMGDTPASIEKYLAAERGNTLRSTVLKVGHHGSRTSSSREFLSRVGPHYAIISAGKDNKYGHPHREVTASLQELEIRAINTADQGTVLFKTNGQKLWQE